MGKYKYEITIVVPVYNNEEYIEACVESIRSQTYDWNKIEVILLDDGSVDGSAQVCEKFAEKHENITFVKHPNSGVSYTRNRGMELANGQYILFLDSDDYLSKEAVEKILEFLDAHSDEVDLVTYPIYNDKNGTISKHFRYRDFFNAGTGVYDLEEDFYLTQTTINVVVKKDCDVVFDQTMAFSEDEKFCTQVLMKKKRLGYVEEAKYYYRKTDTSVTYNRTNPYYTFDSTLEYHEFLVNTYKEDGRIPRYVQCLILNNFKWRYPKDEILPYYKEGKDFEDAVERYYGILNMIETNTVMKLPFLANGLKALILELQNKDVVYELYDDCNVELKCEGETFEFGKLVNCLVRTKVRNNQLFLMGFLDNVCLSNKEFKLFMRSFTVNGVVNQEVEYKVSKRSFTFNDKEVLEKYYFDIVCELEGVSKIQFYVVYQGREIILNTNFTRFTARRICDKKYTVKYKKDRKAFLVAKTDIKERLLATAYYLKRKPAEKRRKYHFYRILSKLFRGKKTVWLYNDRNGYYDNAFYQFKHDSVKTDGIKRYYVYNDEFENIQKLYPDADKSKFIKYKSLKHIVLFINANKIITSFSDLSVYCPFATTIRDYYDLLHYEMIYLQHGILYASLQKMYSKEFTEIDKIVISSTFEDRNLQNRYEYKKEQLIESGMPRYSLTLDPHEGKGKILLAPSWRLNLVGALVNGKRQLNLIDFTNSIFYKSMQSLLESEELAKILLEYNVQLDLKLHPNFKGYEDLFKVTCPNIDIGFGNIEIDDYDLFITDFSSYQFDFVQLKRPIIYFVPDMREFKAGLHSYRKLDLDYEDAFGKLFLEPEGLIGEIKKIVSNNYKMDSVYEERMKNFFIIDSDPCEKIYRDLSGK